MLGPWINSAALRRRIPKRVVDALVLTMLKLLTALIFAAEFGYPVTLIAISQLAIHASLYFGTTLISGPLTRDILNSPSPFQKGNCHFWRFW